MRLTLTAEQHARFMAKVDRSNPDGCWPWAGAIGSHGYGQIKVGESYRLAHRVAFEVFVGEVPRGHCVCHRCDNPPCVNPAHLFTGTNLDNMDDMKRKGRGNVGSRHGLAKLSEQAALAICEAIACGETGVSVAARYGVSRATVSLVANRKHWRHVHATDAR